MNSIAISIPFEFVGNYGWFAGFLSFGLIGVFWSLLSGWQHVRLRFIDKHVGLWLLVARCLVFKDYSPAATTE